MSTNLVRKLSSSLKINFVFIQFVVFYCIIRECINSPTEMGKVTEFSWQYVSLKNFYFVLKTENCLSKQRDNLILHLECQTESLQMIHYICKEHQILHPFIISSWGRDLFFILRKIIIGSNRSTHLFKTLNKLEMYCTDVRQHFQIPLLPTSHNQP